MRKRTIFSAGLVMVIVLVSLAPPAFGKPNDGYTLHIDAKKHLPSNPELIVHHYCKTFESGQIMIECQLYDSDAEDAKLIGAEVLVSRETYSTFSEAEKAMWHDHKVELAKVEVRLPDLPPEEAAKTIKVIEETYGKVYILWDPGRNTLPTGNPSVTILDSTPKAGTSTGLMVVAVLFTAWFFRKKIRNS